MSATYAPTLTRSTPPRPKATRLRRDIPHAVLAAEWVRLGGGTLAVITPLAVDNETILLLSRFQRHGCLPETAVLSLEGYGQLIPAGEVAHEQNGGGIGVTELERLFFFG